MHNSSVDEVLIVRQIWWWWPQQAMIFFHATVKSDCSYMSFFGYFFGYQSYFTKICMILSNCNQTSEWFFSCQKYPLVWILFLYLDIGVKIHIFIVCLDMFVSMLFQKCSERIFNYISIVYWINKLSNISLTYLSNDNIESFLWSSPGIDNLNDGRRFLESLSM